MADQFKDDSPTKYDQAEISTNATANAVWSARRRIIKAGLASVPVVITLRARPLFGKTPSASVSASLAGSTSLLKK